MKGVPTKENGFPPGMWIALALTAVTGITFAIAMLTPPRSGPFCVANCYTYPFVGIEARFPRDYIWMYPALPLAALYTMLFASLHQSAPGGRKASTLIGLVLAAMGSVVLLGDYYVQISVIQPSLLRGEMDGIALLNQYNPHGLFIALEELGYLLMALSFPWMAAAFPGRGRLALTARWTLAGGFLLAVAALAAVAAVYGLDREYRFEVAVIGIDWLVLMAVGSLAAIRFYREGEEG